MSLHVIFHAETNEIPEALSRKFFKCLKTKLRRRLKVDVHEGHELPIERDLLRKYMCDSEGNLISQQTCRHHHHHHQQTAPQISSARAQKPVM